MKKPKICVVGSANYDLIAYTNRIPKIGETIHGYKFTMGYGGKGANQAVTAAKLGAEVVMVAKLGEDIFGKQTYENFKENNINIKHVHFTDKASSGVAPISVDKDGHNSIIVVAGANDLLTEEEIEAARKDIASSKALICQLEVPINVTLKALRIAKEEGVTTIFNPAPAPESGIPEELLKVTDIFCPNETETEILTHMSIKSIEDAEKAGKLLLSKGPSMVIITLGSKGSLLVKKDNFVHISGYPVKAIDTTGAGDCFIGSFAYFYAAGAKIEDAIKKANYVASVSVQRPGTQTSFPKASELPSELFNK